MNKLWIKLYHEILNDPKMGQLSDRLFRRTIELFLLAGECDEGGILPAIEDIAWRLRVDIDTLQVELENLQSYRILTFVDGIWAVTKFAERQEASPATKRWQEWNDRRNKQQYYSNEPTNEPTNENQTNRLNNSNEKLSDKIRLDKIRLDSAPKAQNSPESVLTPEQQAKQHTIQALQKGIDKDGNVKNDVYVYLSITPNWNTKTSRQFLEWVKERPPSETIHKFSLWWYERDWRGKTGQPPTLAQIQELWPQAFLNNGTGPPREFNAARRKQHEDAAEIQRQLDELKKKGTK